MAQAVREIEKIMARIFGQITGGELSDLMHEEDTPWHATKRLPCNIKEKGRSFFEKCRNPDG